MTTHIVHVGPGGPVEVARHQETTAGSPRVVDAHFPPAPAGALDGCARVSGTPTG